MSVEENKAIVRRFWEEAVEKGNLAIIDELIAPSYVHSPSGRRGPEGFQQLFKAFLTAFPDLKPEIEDMIAEGDKVVTRFMWKGTHRGVYVSRVFGTIPPTGNQVAFTSTVITRIAGGKIMEEWENWDHFGLLRQMGAIPPAPAQ